MIYKNMNEAYPDIIKDIELDGKPKTNRKGETIHSLRNYSFTIDDILGSFAACRPGISLNYLQKEFAWYMSGSFQLKDAVACSKFWAKCTDDGTTVNSNYGYLLFHEKNTSDNTQFEHAIACLKNNINSKKAVMTLYNADHAYMSNDNPCTMFLNLYVEENKLCCTAVMRSNDINFGTVYDVPFFCFVLWSAWKQLNEAGIEVGLGNYTHLAMDLHRYESRGPSLEAVEEIAGTLDAERNVMFSQAMLDLYNETYEAFFPTTCPHKKVMQYAYKIAKGSKCLKKKVGAVLVSPTGRTKFAHFGGRHNDVVCVTCARDTGEKFYSDGCYSVHGEMKCIVEAMKDGVKSFNDWTMYTTHGPCDQCLKLCDLVGIKKVIYDHDYKTDYTHWPNVEVLKLSEL